MVTNRKDREDKEVKINEYQTLLNEVSQSINQHSEINGLSIDDAKKEWDLAKGKIADVQQQIDRLESQYESNLDKLKHLEQHEYDPNCQYCMNNVFVKDAIATKEVVKTQESQLETLNIGHHALIKATEPFSDVEDVWSSLIELRNKYQKGEIIIQKTQAEWDGLGTQYELLITQLSGIKADINRYNAISETIIQNKEINELLEECSKEINTNMTKLSQLIFALDKMIELQKQVQQTLREKFVKENKIDRITFYALNPHPATCFDKPPSKEYYAQWISKTREAFPDLDIVAGAWTDKIEYYKDIMKYIALYPVNRYNILLSKHKGKIGKLCRDQIFI